MTVLRAHNTIVMIIVFVVWLQELNLAGNIILTLKIIKITIQSETFLFLLNIICICYLYIQELDITSTTLLLNIRIYFQFNFKIPLKHLPDLLSLHLFLHCCVFLFFITLFLLLLFLCGASPPLQVSPIVPNIMAAGSCWRSRRTWWSSAAPAPLHLPLWSDSTHTLRHERHNIKHYA